MPFFKNSEGWVERSLNPAVLKQVGLSDQKGEAEVGEPGEEDISPCSLFTDRCFSVISRTLKFWKNTIIRAGELIINWFLVSLVLGRSIVKKFGSRAKLSGFYCSIAALRTVAVFPNHHPQSTSSNWLVKLVFIRMQGLSTASRQPSAISNQLSS
jgi:hypothetical protein